MGIYPYGKTKCSPSSVPCVWARRHRWIIEKICMVWLGSGATKKTKPTSFCSCSWLHSYASLLPYFRAVVGHHKLMIVYSGGLRGGGGGGVLCCAVLRSDMGIDVVLAHTLGSRD